MNDRAKSYVENFQPITLSTNRKGGPFGPPFFLQILLTYLDDADIAASSCSLRFSTSILIKSSLLGFFPRTISS